MTRSLLQPPRTSSPWSPPWIPRADGPSHALPGGAVGGWFRRQADSRSAARWAARMLEADAVVIDTETTDFGGAICELAVVDLAEKVLLQTLLDPGRPITPEASRVHGLTDDDVAGQPRFVDVLDELLACTAGRPVLAYNAPFDHAALCNDAQRAGIDLQGLEHPERWGCVMRARAAVEHSDYWQPLHGGHRARSDAAAAARIVRQIAAPRGMRRGPASRNHNL